MGLREDDFSDFLKLRIERISSIAEYCFQRNDCKKQSCFNLTILVLALVEEFPSAPTLLDLAKDIVDSPDIECSDDEKEALKAQVAEVESAEEAVSAELDVALADLTVSVGSTPSSAALASVAAAEETTAATATTRTRRRIFRNFNQQN